MEAVGRSGTFRSLARVAVSARRADGSLAIRLCVVCSGAAALGAAGDFQIRRLQIRRPRIRRLESRHESEAPIWGRHPLRRAFLISYFCGVLWYVGNCYWIRDTMMRYGDMPPLAPELLTLGFSLVLGLYFGLFGLGLVLVQPRHWLGAHGARRSRPFSGPASTWPPRASPAFHGTSLATRRSITRSSISSLRGRRVRHQLVLVAVNALLAGDCWLGELEGGSRRLEELVRGPLGLGRLRRNSARLRLRAAFLFRLRSRIATATAVLIQPNLDVGAGNNWQGPEWDRHIAEFARLAGEQCKTIIAGIPQTGAPTGEIICPPYPTHPDLVVWPESPAPFYRGRRQLSSKPCSRLPIATHAPLVVGGVGIGFRRSRTMHGAITTPRSSLSADGKMVGRYDKIHLVPFGEYIPFQNLLYLRA